ncbi:MAG: glycine cleavage system protein GcvH [Candidatus Nanopelagicales bacterium]
MNPADLKYTAEHEWVRAEDDGTLVFGITGYAQEALGDIVYVSLPEPGAALDAGSPCGEVESTKSVSDIYSPVSGTVVEANASLADAPETVNTDPYGTGWMVRIRPDDTAAVDALLSAEAYDALIAGLAR